MKLRKEIYGRNTLDYKLPPSILLNIYKLLIRADTPSLQNLRDSLNADPFIISHKFFENDNGYRKYCLIALLAEINTNKFYGKSDLCKVKAAHRVAVNLRDVVIEHVRNRAVELRGEPMFFEEYFKDRYTRHRANGGEGCFLTGNEVSEIIQLCDKVLGARSKNVA